MKRSVPHRYASVLAALAVGALAALSVERRAGAGEPDAAARDRQTRERELLELVTRARSAVVLLKTATGVASGVVIDAGQLAPPGARLEVEEGIVATSKARLAGAGTIEAHAFVRKVTDDGRVIIERAPLGPVEVVAVHRSADAALLRLPSRSKGASGLSPLQAAKSPPAPGSRVRVCGVQGAVRFEQARDLDAREGKVLRAPAPTDGFLILSAPTHMNSAGGAVLDSEGRLAGIASFARRRASEGAPGFVLPEGADGLGVPLARFRELLAGRGRSLSEAQAAAHLAPRPGLPPHLVPHRAPPSPGGLAGKRLRVGPGVTVIRKPRAVIATGVFILDRHEMLEYFATPRMNGKLHETVIAVDSDPRTVNLALLYLKYESGGGVEKLGDPRKPIGEQVLMYVEWDHNEATAIRGHLARGDPRGMRPAYDDVLEKVREGVIKWEPGPRVRVRAEDLMFNRVRARPMRHTHWVYTGSSIEKDDETGKRYYMATTTGVLAAVYRDPAAVFNIPLEGAEDDTYYCVRDTIVPPRGTRCSLLILPAEPKKAEEAGEVQKAGGAKEAEEGEAAEKAK